MSDEEYRFVRYRPWRGDLYGSSKSIFGPKGTRVLIVGESHYWYEGCVDDPGLTVRVFEARAADERYEFDDKIAAAVLGREKLDDLLHSRFWRSVAFYNYIRHLMPDSSIKPTRKMFGEREALEAFREVLATLTPNLVLMFAQTVWNWLPKYDRDDQAAKAFIGLEPGFFTTSGGGEALVLGLYHPSAWRRYGQSAMYWHPFIRRAMEYCAHQPQSPLGSA